VITKLFKQHPAANPFRIGEEAALNANRMGICKLTVSRWNAL